ncbi:hypothetical protein [Vibrio nomapromontoriensis]|uniref:hypothetical protein n=1 Tax=Vibrio nomapromontoriensis TaxID=2910246 RepID=UPI003D14B0A6
MRLIYLIILITISIPSFALQPGQCSVNPTITYTGSDITIGPLSGGNERLLGYLELHLPYTCRTYTTATDGTSIQLGLNNSHNSHISGTRFRSNIDGVELNLVGNTIAGQAVRIAGQPGTGVRLWKWPTSQTALNTEITATWNFRLFEVYQTGTISTMATKAQIGLSGNYQILVFRGENTSSDTFNTGSTFPKSQEVKLVDPTCQLNYQPNQNIGNLIKGRSKSIDFDINLVCTHATTIQNNFEWRFSASGTNVSTSSDKTNSLYYGGNDLPIVVMNIESLRNDSSSAALLFGDSYLFLNPTNTNTFNFPLRANFTAGSGSHTGDFSFKLNFQLDYN